MNPRKGRLLAWGSVGGGMVVLLVCAFALRGRIVEEYWLWRLESGNLEEQKVAAERLAGMGSVRAVPVFLEKLRSSAGRLAIGDFDGDGVVDLYVPFDDPAAPVGNISEWQTEFLLEERDPFEKALREITKVRGKACVPHLVKALAEKNWAWRFLIAVLLGQIGPEAREAIPALTTALEDDDELVRQAAAEALEKIKGHEETER